MSKLIKDSTLLGIADAIRSKAQTSDLIKVKDFASVIGNIEVGSPDGQYAWEKRSVEAKRPALTSTSTITETDNGFTIATGTSSAGSGWTKHFFNSAEIKLSAGMEIDIYHTFSTGGTTYFIGFSDTATKTYTDQIYSVMIDGSTLYQATGGTKGTSYGACTVGDEIHINLKDGLMSVYRNDTFLFSFAVAFEQYVVSAHFYQANYNYEFEIVADIAENIGYVIGNEEDAYPNDGYADDGYYYVKVGATKVTPKYASGTVNAVAGIMTVTGLAFKPVAVIFDHASTTLACGICDEVGGTTIAKVKMGSANNASVTFTPKDDGFVFNWNNSGTANDVTWYAIGY